MSETLIYLYILIGGYNNYTNVSRVPFSTYSECWATLEKSKIDNSHGAESENFIVMFCGPSGFDNRANSVKFHKESK